MKKTINCFVCSSILEVKTCNTKAMQQNKNPKFRPLAFYTNCTCGTKVFFNPIRAKNVRARYLVEKYLDIIDDLNENEKIPENIILK